MSDQYFEAIDNLKDVIQSARLFLESYKIAHQALSTLISNRKLAEFLAHTFLRNLILLLCIVFKKSSNDSLQTNLSLEKVFNRTFVTKNISRVDLNVLINNCMNIIKDGNFNKIRNQKIAHLDLQILSDPKIDLNNPDNYETLVSGAEQILIEIIKENNLKESYKKIDSDTDERLIQLSNMLNSA